LAASDETSRYRYNTGVEIAIDVYERSEAAQKASLFLPRSE
jgi:hypothetical protein